MFMCCRKGSPRQSPRLRSRLEKGNKEQMVLVCIQQETPHLTCCITSHLVSIIVSTRHCRAVVVMIILQLDLLLPMHSVHNTTNESSNPAQVRCTLGRWFSQGTPVFSTKKTDSHNITDILLKVALSTIAHKTLSSSLIEFKCVTSILKVFYTAPNEETGIHNIYYTSKFYI